jgi:hypothetical protein
LMRPRMYELKVLLVFKRWDSSITDIS